MAVDRRSDRQAALRRRMAGEGLDALLVSHLPNLRYLTGFTGTAGLLIVTPVRAVLITDFRYAEQAPEECRGAAEVAIEATDLLGKAGRFLEWGASSRFGFERERTSVRDLERFEGSGSFHAVPTQGLVEGLRESKDADEVAAIAAAAALAHEAFTEVAQTIRVGDSELDVAARLEFELRRRGSEWHPFQTIVAAGERSALPHARATRRPIARGELLLIDFGAQLDGYCADITRTAVVGAPPNARQREIHSLVERAQHHAREGIRAGMTGAQADALARELIASEGYGPRFGHSLGHGLGLEVHEGPRLARTAPEALPVGAVVTVEPGVYLPEWGGVRLEDDIHLTAHGPRCLTDGRTELLELH